MVLTALHVPCSLDSDLGPSVWVGRVGGDDGQLRPWHYRYVYSIESRLIMRVRYSLCHSRWAVVSSSSRCQENMACIRQTQPDPGHGFQVKSH